jgi:hypothetical protein
LQREMSSTADLEEGLDDFNNSSEASVQVEEVGWPGASGCRIFTYTQLPLPSSGRVSLGDLLGRHRQLVMWGALGAGLLIVLVLTGFTLIYLNKPEGEPLDLPVWDSYRLPPRIHPWSYSTDIWVNVPKVWSTNVHCFRSLTLPRRARCVALKPFVSR